MTIRSRTRRTPPEPPAIAVPPGHGGSDAEELLLSLRELGPGDLGVILELPTGVWYETDMAGYAVRARRMQGAYYPLPLPKAALMLAQELDGVGGLGEAHVTAAHADLIDKLLAPYGIAVDRTQLADSVEAWVHVHCLPHVRGARRSGIAIVATTAS